MSKKSLNPTAITSAVDKCRAAENVARSRYEDVLRDCGERIAAAQRERDERQRVARAELERALEALS